MKIRNIKTEIFDKKIKSNQVYLSEFDLKKWINRIKEGQKTQVIIHKGYIIDGNHRKEAFKRLKNESIPCLFLTAKDLENYLFYTDKFKSQLSIIKRG